MKNILSGLRLLLTLATVATALSANAQSAQVLKSLVTSHGSLAVGDVVFTNFQTPRSPPSTFMDSQPNDGNDVAVSTTLTADGRVGLVFTPIDSTTGVATPFHIDAASGPGSTSPAGVLRYVTYDVVVTNPQLRLRNVDLSYGPGTREIGATEAFNFVYYFDTNGSGAVGALIIDQRINGQPTTGVPSSSGGIVIPGADLTGLRFGSEWGLASGPWGGIRQGNADLDYTTIIYSLAPVDVQSVPLGVDIKAFFPDAIYLTNPAPVGGATIMLSSSDPAVIAVPIAMSIPQGATYAVLPAVIGIVAFPTPVSLSATFNGVTKTTQRYVFPGDATTPPAPPTVSVTLTGKGKVTTANKSIDCGIVCTATYAAGSLVAMTAAPGSGSSFTSWTGACSGAAATCTVSVNGQDDVGAVFTPLPSGGGGGGGGTATPTLQLKVSTSNPGVVTSNVGGINCGTVCSANVAVGTVVMLTATPPAGKTFAGWSGACTSSAPICIVSVNANLSAKASFNK